MLAYIHFVIYESSWVRCEHNDARTARPNGVKREYFIGLKKGLFASSKAGKINFILIMSNFPFKVYINLK